MTDLQQFAANLPADIVSPTWSNDPFNWSFYVPSEIREAWPILEPLTKAVVYLTANEAAQHLKDCGVFDN